MNDCIRGTKINRALSPQWGKNTISVHLESFLLILDATSRYFSDENKFLCHQFSIHVLLRIYIRLWGDTWFRLEQSRVECIILALWLVPRKTHGPNLPIRTNLGIFAGMTGKELHSSLWYCWECRCEFEAASSRVSPEMRNLPKH